MASKSSSFLNQIIFKKDMSDDGSDKDSDEESEEEEEEEEEEEGESGGEAKKFLPKLSSTNFKFTKKNKVCTYTLSSTWMGGLLAEKKK